MEWRHLLTFDDLRSNNDVIDWGYLKSLVPVKVERQRVFSNLDGLLYLAGKLSVLPVKDLDVVSTYGMMCFSAVFFDCRWNATWGRRFMFFNSLTQLSASLSNISCRALLATTGCPRMFYTMFQKNIKNIKSTMSLIIMLVIECLICAFPTVKISFTYLYPLRCDMVSLKIDE